MKKVDPQIEEKIETSNPRRVLRAYEIIKQTSKPLNLKKRECPYDFLEIAKDCEIENLYKKIDMRVDQMMEGGLLDEVKNLKDFGYQEKSSAV